MAHQELSPDAGSRRLGGSAGHNVAADPGNFTPAEAPRGVRRAAGLAGRIGFAAYAWLVLGFLASLALLAVVLLPGQRRRRAVVYRLDRAPSA